jgi:hypothetical protein
MKNDIKYVMDLIIGEIDMHKSITGIYHDFLIHQLRLIFIAWCSRRQKAIKRVDGKLLVCHTLKYGLKGIILI